MRYFVILMLPLFAFAQNAKDEGWSQLLPPGEGRDLVLMSCATCHNVKVVVHARKNPEDWTKSIGDMIQRGAPIFVEEIAPITAYLSKHFGPGIPALVNVNAASREELEKVANMKPEIAARILEMRSRPGGFRNGDDLRQALGMTNDDFEKIRYALKYSN